MFSEMQYKQINLYHIGTPEIYEERERVGDKHHFADKYGYSPEKIAQFVSKLESGL